MATASIIIPAHDEQRVIARCLGRVLDDARPGEFDVVVVCNGCTDATADIARRASSDVRVVETSVASKNHALNVGDAVALGFPRVYLDADVELDTASLRAVVAVLRDGALAAGPGIRFALDAVPWPVAAYFRTWSRLGYGRSPMCGSGVYGLSERGRARFGPFPEHVADDAWVRFRFAPGEREAVPGAQFTFHPPRSLRRLIATQTRSAVLARDVRRDGPGRRESYGWSELLGPRPRTPALAEATAYTLIRVAVRVLAARRVARGDVTRWDRDDTSRGP